MISERIKACLESGSSIYVATVDRNGMPSCSRAIAVRADEDGNTATVYMPIANSRDTFANLTATNAIAVVLTKPIEHASVQLKGTSRTTRLARDDEEAFVRSRLDGLAEVLVRLGVPRRVTHSLPHWPAFAIEMDIEQTFDQTPGPRAGTPLR
jgi:general stress protein 26